MTAEYLFSALAYLPSLAQAEERQDCENDDNCANDVDDAVHGGFLS